MSWDGKPNGFAAKRNKKYPKTNGKHFKREQRFSLSRLERQLEGRENVPIVNTP